MAFKPPLEQGELHSRNFRSVRDWIERNKGQIKAKPNQTALYSGNDYDFDFRKGMTEQEMQETEGTPMWKRLQQMRKQMCDLRVPYAFQTLEEVLKTIKHYPALVDKDHQDQPFENAHDFFVSLETYRRLSPLVPDQKKLLEKKVSTYGDHFDRRYTTLIAQLREGKADLTRKRR